ncbi:MAG: fibronectin type III domain-containing protein [Actinomycetota bacterium]
MRGKSYRRRIVFAALVISVLATGLAKADPVSDALSALFNITDVKATGVDPTQIIVSWKDRSIIESGAYVQYAIGLNAEQDGQYQTAQTVGPCQTLPPGVAATTKPDGVIVPATCTTTLTNELLHVGPAFEGIIWIRIVPFLELPTGSGPGTGTPILVGTPSLADPAMFGPLRPTDVLCNGGGPTACENVTSVTITWTNNGDQDENWIFRVPGVPNPKFTPDPYKRLGGQIALFHENISGNFGAVFSYKVTAVREESIPLAADPRRGDQLNVDEISYSDGGVTSTSRGSNGTTIIPVKIAPVPAPSDPCCLIGTFTYPNTVTITWTDQANPPNPYTDEDGWFIELGPSTNPDDFQSMWSTPGTPGQGQRSYVDHALVPERGVRCYRVRGWRAPPDGQLPAVSAYTNAVCFGAIPKAPTNLVAVPQSNASVHVTWRDNSTTEDHYRIQRCTGVCTNATGTWVTLDDGLPINATSYLDANTVGLTTYSYRAFAVNASGPSAPSNVSVITTPKSPLPAPSALNAQGRQHAIYVTWQDNSTSETGFRLEYRAPGASVWALLDEVGPNVTAYLDSQSLAANQTRCYRVRALKFAAASDPSNEDCATTLPPMAPNAAPSDLDGIVNSNTSIVLTWMDNSNNESAFSIDVATASNVHCYDPVAAPQSLTFHHLTNAVPINPSTHGPYDINSTGARSFTVTGLLPHSAYYFRIKAINWDGESDLANASPAAGATGGLENVTACGTSGSTVRGTTFGPPAPVFNDPNVNNETNATRCDMTILAPRGAHDTVGGLKVEVLSQIDGSNIASSDIIYADASSYSTPGQVADGDGGIVPGSDPNRRKYIVEDGDSSGFAVDNANNKWTVPYYFRHGITYKLFVTAYLQDAPYWSSQRPILTGVTVAADCPLPKKLGNTP